MEITQFASEKQAHLSTSSVHFFFNVFKMLMNIRVEEVIYNKNQKF